MLDKKDLRGAAVLFRDLSELLIAWADDLDKNRKKGRKSAAIEAPVEAPAETPTVEPVAVKEEISEEETSAVAAPTASDKSAVSDEPAVPMAPFTYDAVHDYVGYKLSKGFRSQIIALFNSYGAQKFSEVDPAYYGDLVETIAGLGVDSGGDVHAS